jgi:creatinine deaminase
VSANEPLTDAQARLFLPVALEEARLGLAEGGIPIGAALFHRDGTLLGRGHNRRVQDDDASTHAETAAFRNAGRRRHYADCVMVTTLSPCWYCSGLIRQFQIGAVGGDPLVAAGEVLGLAHHHGAEVIVLDDPECTDLLGSFIADHPELWNEDIGL